MRKEDLLDGFGSLDDALLQRSEKGGTFMENTTRKYKIITFGSIAACLIIALGVNGIFTNKNRDTHSGAAIDNNNVTESSSDIFNEQVNISEEHTQYKDVSMLLASNENIEDQSLAISQIQIDEYCANYYKVTSVDSIILKESTGKGVEETKNWYRVSGHEDMQYLIFCENNEYSLWKFDCFTEDSYPYNDVLQIIYHIYSANDIQKVFTEPANMDNTDNGKEIQKEIGTGFITDSGKIEAFYGILSHLTCYGSDNWEMIGLGDDSRLGMQNQMYAGRYLTIVTAQGMEIDTLKYTGISGMFYEYGGIAYSQLTPDEKNTVEEILNINFNEVTEKKDTSKFNINSNSDILINKNTDTTVTNASSDENDNHNTVSDL